MREVPREIDPIASIVVDRGFKLHKGFGPGLLEPVYETIASVLHRRRLSVERQKPLAIQYGGLILAEGFKVDLLVEGCRSWS